MKKTCLGFTLVEILVAVSIFVIIFGLALIQYQGYNRRQIFQRAIEELESNLRLAQGRAITGKKPHGVNWCADSGESLKGYRLYFEANGIDYKIQAACSNSADDSLPESIIKSANLPGGGQVTATGGPVVFKVLGLGVEGATSFTLTGFNGAESGMINISVTGEIEEI